MMSEDKFGEIIKKVFLAGYEKGHNDTVESCYSPEQSADDFLDDNGNELSRPKVTAEEIEKILVRMCDDCDGTGTFQIPDASDKTLHQCKCKQETAQAIADHLNGKGEA